MIRAYWNALRVNDEVCVHDDSDPEFAITAGKVAFVDTRGDTNVIAARVIDDAGVSTLVRPKRLAVHLHERDSRADCWRCGLRR
jgi:hypothetical protein